MHASKLPSGWPWPPVTEMRTPSMSTNRPAASGPDRAESSFASIEGELARLAGPADSQGRHQVQGVWAGVERDDVFTASRKRMNAKRRAS